VARVVAVVSQTGSTTSLSATDSGWSQEIALDVEWAHATAPGAEIMLVEASSATTPALLTADRYAAAHGAGVVADSWGGSEASGEASLDPAFTAVKGVTFVFAAGDTGVQSYPSTSPDVVSVGGTTLSHNASYQWAGETAWVSGGGGTSAYEAEPSYQTFLNGATRAAPDLSYDADPNTGFAVYDSVATQGQAGWFQIGGTSEARRRSPA